MKTHFNWTKGIFSNTCNIYSNQVLIGYLKDKAFSQTTTGIIHENPYTFRTRGILKQKTEIVDSAKNEVIGEIIYNNWMTKAVIYVNGKTIHWKYDNIWNTKWSLYDSEGIIMNFSGSSTKGNIETNTDDLLLLLTGLSITNYYRQTSIAVLVAVFIPIWITVLK